MAKRKADRAKIRNTRRPTSRGNDSRPSTAGSIGYNENVFELENDDEEIVYIPKLESYFAKQPCMLSTTCRLRHGKYFKRRERASRNGSTVVIVIVILIS